MGLEIKKNISQLRTKAAFAAIGLAGLTSVLNPSIARANNDCGDVVKIDGNHIVFDPSISGKRVSYTYSTGFHAYVENVNTLTQVKVDGPIDSIGTCEIKGQDYHVGFEFPAQQRALLFSEVQNPS